MTDTDALVDSLRFYQFDVTHKQMTAAADLIERQAAEIERLREALDEAEHSRTLNHAAAKIALDQRDEARAALAEAQKDAERYRWLRNSTTDADRARLLDGCMSPGGLDAAIDAALANSRDADQQTAARRALDEIPHMDQEAHHEAKDRARAV